MQRSGSRECWVCAWCEKGVGPFERSRPQACGVCPHICTHACAELAPVLYTAEHLGALHSIARKPVGSRGRPSVEAQEKAGPNTGRRDKSRGRGK
eukprot:9237214-Pyramimonas_sp.AAC.1